MILEFILVRFAGLIVPFAIGPLTTIYSPRYESFVVDPTLSKDG